jgi:regulator of protease activity HflC (stomatin/prohibitin superfamily)
MPSDGPDVAKRLARTIALWLAASVCVLVLSCSMTKRIDAGHVGIRVKLAGSSRGVQDMPVVTGWVFYNPLTEQLVEFPTSVQNVVWTAAAHEGRAVDESITFSSNEGVNVNADVGLSFHIEPHMAPQLYLRFRQTNLELLADGYMRNAVREAFNDAASRLPVQEIYGAGKGALVAEVMRKLREVLGKDGVVIDQLTINGALRLPENVAQAINRAMEATQNAIQAENRVRQVRAEAEQAVAKAHGDAEAARARARGDADATLIRARSEAKANQIIRYSTSPAVLQYRALERWNGKLPTVNSGQIPMLTIDAAKLGAAGDDEKKLNQLLAAEEEAAAAPAPAPAVASDAPAPAPHAPAAPPAPAAPKPAAPKR